MRNRIFARFVMAFTSIFMAIETNAAELGSFGPYIPGAQMELDLGLIGYKAKKLPSGLKLDKKTGFVKGKARKPGEYISTFTKKDDETHTAKFVIGPLRTITISMEGDIEKCKVTGATKPGKGYLVGKKVTLSAKGPKGTAFNGWFMAGKPWPNESEYLESRVRHVMTEENLSLVARFEKEKMSVLCNRLLKPIPVGRDFSTPILIETQSGIKSVRASKLPTGLKVKKDKSTGAWYIQGKAKKEGVWKTVIKVTAKSGAVEQLAINVTVNDGTSSGGNLTDANGYFTDNLQNGDGEKYSLSMDSGDVDSLLPSLALSSSSAKLDVTGLPEGLTYDSSTGKIKGKATKAGSYTVTLTVTDNGSIYISTITIVVGAPANSCDLLVSSVTATRTTVYIGEKFNLRYVVKNGSNFDSQLFKNKISAPGGFSAIEQVCGGIAKNDEVAFRAQIDSGRLGVGSHVVTIQADSSNDAIEADETNNQKTITLKVVELPTTSAVVDWEFKAKAENPSAAFLSTASQSQLETFNFNRGETIYTQINFWNRLRQLVPEKITVSALLDTGVSDTWYWWNGLQADVIAFIPDEHRRASKLQALPSGVYTLEILLDSNRFVNSDGLYYYEANKLNNSQLIEFTIAGDNRVVTFDANGGSLSSNTKSLIKGSKLGETQEPTLSGYRFAGWYTAKDGGVEITRETIIAKNMTLYAKWTAKPYTVRFHANDGHNETFDQVFTTGVEANLRTISSLKWRVNGYRFSGWATSADGEIKYRDGETISHIATDSNDVAHLYAVWTYEIIFHKNDESGTTTNQICRLHDDQRIMRINEDLEWDNPTDLFTFAGWATSPDGSVKYDDGVTVVLSNDAVINLYAVWRGTEYIVRFHKSSDSTMSEDQLHTVGISKALTTITELAWRMDGCEFAGWSTIQGGDVEFADGEEVRNLKEESGEVYNLYAVWTYKIIYHKGAGLTNAVSQIQKYGSEQRLFLIGRDLGWSIPGATFKGWAVTEGGDVRYSDGLNSAEITPKMTEIHLYAVWEYNVKYYKNDGTSQTDNQTHTLGKSLALLKISDDLKWNNSGYYFVGWATEPNGSVVYADGQSVIDILPASGAVNLYAVWRGNNYTVKFHKNFGSGASEIFAQTNTVGVAQELLGYTNFNWGVTGYRFAGWATSTTGDAIFSDGQEVEDLTMSAWGNYNLYAVWSYDVRYIKNDGTSETASDTFIVGKEKPLMDITSQLKWSVVDREFLGWATSNVVCTTEEDYANAIEYINAQKVTDIEPYVAGGEDCVRNLYAVWRGNEYTVRFHKSKDSTITFDQKHIIDIPRALLTIEDLKWNMNGYEFAGWSTKATGEVEYTDGEEVENLKNATGDVVDLYAVWTYKIIYHKGAGLTNTVTQVQKYGSEQRLYLIDRDLGWSIPGATFKGWAVTEGGDVRYSDGFNSAEITPKMTEIYLYPVWEYSVKYHKNDGSSLTFDQIHTLGKSLALLKISDDLKWNKNGCYFIGWATEPNGSVVYADGQSVIDILPASGVVNLYAVWRGNNYTVKFHKNFGSGASEIFAQTNTVGVAQELLGYTNFNWGVTGYRFAGWATSTTGDAIFSDGQEVEDLTMSAWGNYDLYAVWEYDVKYNKNDGTNESTNETFVVGKEQALMDINSDLNWSVVGKVFLGWATNQVDYTSTADYTDAVVYSNSVVVTDITPDPDTPNKVVRELYAVWIPSYSIDFHSNDGTSRSKLLTIVGDEDAVLPSVGDDWQWEKPKNDDINGFIGWALTADATGEVYNVNYKIKDIKDIPPGQTINLYAVWENERYAIMYHKNDGSGIIVTNTYALEEYHTLQDVNKDLNWTVNEDDFFYGWSTLPMDSTGTNTVYTNCYEVTTGYIEGIKEDKHVDLYAIWKVTNRALDVTLDQNLEFKWDGGASWFAQDAVKKNGYLAMQSGELLEGESSILQTEISGPVNISFWWKVSAREDYGKLGVWIDDKEKYYIYGNDKGFRDWELYSFDIPEGSHTIKWVYTQILAPDQTAGGGNEPDSGLLEKTLNCGWVDGLTITPISGGSDIPSVANTTQYALRSVGATTTTTMSLLDSSRITGQFVDDSTLFELLVDDVNAAITSGKLTEYCEEGVVMTECDVERVEEGLVLTQDNRIILIKISNGVVIAEIIMD